LLFSLHSLKHAAKGLSAIRLILNFHGWLGSLNDILRRLFLGWIREFIRNGGRLLLVDARYLTLIGSPGFQLYRALGDRGALTFAGCLRQFLVQRVFDVDVFNVV